MKLNSHERTLWAERHMVTPYLVEQVFGDGKYLIALSPMNYRPNYYVVQIDSAWVEKDTYGDGYHCNDEFRDNLDEIYNQIEEEFGFCCEDHETCECSGYEVWPMCTSGSFEGSSWCVFDQSDIDFLFEGLYSDLADRPSLIMT